MGVVDPKMTFPRKLSLLLMVADFVDLARGREAVLVQLGIDEHQYMRFAHTARQFSDTHTCGSARLAAVA